MKDCLRVKSGGLVHAGHPCNGFLDLISSAAVRTSIYIYVYILKPKPSKVHLHVFGDPLQALVLHGASRWLG